MDKSISALRADFPILDQQVNDEPLVYLDNAATAQRPTPVLKRVLNFYQTDNANVHRGVHTLAERATTDYEAARDKVRTFIHANKREEVIFTKGCTDSLNLVAATYGEQNIQAGDEIVISIMEHHSNLIPWQQLALKKGATLKYIGLTKEGELDLADAAAKITDRTKIVAVTHASNVMGTVTPLKQLAKLAHQHGAIIVGDGAQAVPHMKVDVTELDVDFYAFSGHKMMSPTGIGVLYGKQALLEAIPPYQYGGEMIGTVTEQASTWAALPYKFEAGTQNIAGAVGLGAAIDYLTAIGMDQVEAHERVLVQTVLPQLLAIEGLTVYGPTDPAKHTGVISFNLGHLHPHDLATALDMEGVAVRAGHHCAQPLMNYLGLEASARASFYLYNTAADAEKLVSALKEAKEFFRIGTI
ncbi:cysteine desulfurase [Limosilactobacillus fermentum]|uniref:Cysteine desulfurase n=1 Tax=Limosilactobacillus fermentum TaxID=1613 RepID=A0AAJ5ZTD5_LIMFE|nr:cysteine desulfurase [Limosilactobacillus fermentum]MED7634692.1 cysteine desulfurase [Limosilactobacillus fermentum]PTS40109.1 cysteine desulfurase [Limosilactobacillus fermentum]WFR88423.1 cysteine desulfurase [Limosilactobacillus fermentum]WRQ24669.1 cysteine desulfurase [Limosilactobacillus fermentum]SNX31705.1 cysteine desulfurase SufS [Limosilactobacillus fermentum]